MKTFLTLAPAAYDYEYVERETSPFVAVPSGQRYDWVRIPDESADYQVGRYNSGMHIAIEQDDIPRWLDLGVMREEG